VGLARVASICIRAAGPTKTPKPSGKKGEIGRIRHRTLMEISVNAEKLVVVDEDG
jgi:hypothetical protein